MGNFVNRTTLQGRRSANDPEHPDPPWLFVPSGSDNESVMLTVPREYRKISGDVLSEMSRAEKDVVDAAALEASRDANADEFDDTESVLRAFMRAVLDELNSHASKTNEILDAADEATSIADFNARLVAITDYPQRSPAQMKTAVRNRMGT